MAFTPFQNMMTRAANRYGISKEFCAIKVCRAFEKVLPEVFKGLNDEQQAALRYNVRAKFYKKNTLFVSVKGSAWSSEIMMHKYKILEKLKVDFPFIKDLKTIELH